MKRNWRTLVVILTLTFFLMVLLVVFIVRANYRTSFSYVHELGEDKTSAITADLENYLENAKSVLWVAADTVDHMVEQGATNEEIIEYITRESSNTEAQFDESYTGLYGVIRGEYVDGVGWVPPEDYDPTARDWYKATVAAGGEPVIVSPYVDAQTGNVIISIGKSLTDPNNALALDLTLSGVQDIIEDIEINGYGYGFILNNDGMVIAHQDKTQNGKYYDETSEQIKLYNEAMKVNKGTFEMEINGETSTVFVDDVMEQWHLVIVISTRDLFREPGNLLIVSIVIIFVVFVLLSLFYIMGYRYERRVYSSMEELKEIEQRREYEAKILKLEKSAADTANKAKSDFLADMSHEIRTPINAVLGMNEMILRESKDENILDYASNIKSAGNTLLSIINTILDFSKIEDGRMQLIPVEFDVVELLNGLVNSISKRAEDKGLEFIVDVDESIPSRLRGDDVRISQVIMNLLTNAVKYTEKGSVTLRVVKKFETNDMVKLRVAVIDTGIGIKEEDLDKLYISFERIEEKRNRHIEGTGLGISIVTKLLTMMDSELKVESKYGQGSKFYFDISLRIDDAEPIGVFDEKRRVLTGNTEEITGFSAESARILVTDDNEMNLKVVSNLMKLFSVTPVTCSSGRETIEELRKNSYDILFLDHMMPGMDGIDTLKVLKEEGLVDNTTVIALTANAVVGAREQYLEAGFDGYLSKPINIRELENVFKEYLPEEVKTSEVVENTEDKYFEEAPLADEVQETEAASQTGLTIEKARSIGLSVDEGIGFSGGDEEFYLEILKDYAESYEERCNSLSEFLEQEDWKNYKILVHSVKSSSKTVGAMEISELALSLEEASGREDAEYVKQHHGELIEEYKELKDKLLG